MHRNESVKSYNCKECVFKTPNQAQLQKHVLIHCTQQKEKEFNCTKCDFQATSNLQLSKHSNLKHALPDKDNRGNLLKCNNCGEEFGNKRNLMIHRKSKHSNTVAPCKNKLVGKCSFTDEMCWWKHGDISEKSSESIMCYICNETFESKTKMMLHRKIDHRNLVRMCNNYLEKNCMFQSKSCWFLHDEEVFEHEEDIDKEDEGIKNESDSVFQNLLKNKKPPIGGNKKKQKTD